MEECNCNDEFKTKPCPVHHADLKLNEPKVQVVSDISLVDDKVRQWTGLVFKCSNCGEESIMDFFNYCSNCGTKIKVQSKTLTNAINKLSACNG